MSRTDGRSSGLRHRPARTVPASIVAVIVLALGVGLVWITVLRLRDGRWPGFLGRVNGWATALTWGSAVALLIGLAAVVAGLVLLVAGITPGRPNAMRLSVPPSTGVVQQTELVMSRRGVAKLATSSATQVDGVDAVSAAVSGRRVSLSVRSPSEQRDELRGSVTTTVREALSAAGLDPVPSVRTVVRTTRV